MLQPVILHWVMNWSHNRTQLCGALAHTLVHMTECESPHDKWGDSICNYCSTACNALTDQWSIKRGICQPSSRDLDMRYLQQLRDAMKTHNLYGTTKPMCGNCKTTIQLMTSAVRTKLYNNCRQVKFFV